MPQLVIEQPGAPAMTVPLSGVEICLGRAEDSQVILVADEVSRHHAKINRRGDVFVLTDLNSLNGTYVNRQRMSERVLAHLDDIWFGSKCHLVFRDDTSLGRTGAPRPHESTLIQDLEKIRTNMDRLGDSLTLISKRGGADRAVAIKEGAAPELSPEEVVGMGRAYRRLAALFQASKLIASAFDLRERLAAVLDTAIGVTEAERGFVMLQDGETGGLKVSVAREMGHDLHAGSPSMGIAGKAAIDGEPVLMVNAEGDAQFGLRDSIISQQIRSAMCVPLRIEDRVLGSIYVDTRRAGHAFSQEDIELFASLAAQLALAIDNVRLYQQTVEEEKKRANLGRFLSPSVIEMIAKEDTSIELGGRKQTVTTMFCDIRGFTLMAERLSPAALVDMLNEHFTAMTGIVFHFQGTLDKYIGDEVMAVFGSPLSAPDDAERAVRAGLAMQAKNAELNGIRLREGREVFDFGVGIDTGEVIAAYMGSPERMEFTVIGDRVNTARRLCSLAAGGQVVVGESTYELVKELVYAKPIGTVVLRGKEAPVHAYEITALK